MVPVIRLSTSTINFAKITEFVSPVGWSLEALNMQLSLRTSSPNCQHSVWTSQQNKNTFGKMLSNTIVTVMWEWMWSWQTDTNKPGLLSALRSLQVTRGQIYEDWCDEKQRYTLLFQMKNKSRYVFFNSEKLDSFSSWYMRFCFKTSSVCSHRFVANTEVLVNKLYVIEGLMSPPLKKNFIM